MSAAHWYLTTLTGGLNTKFGPCSAAINCLGVQAYFSQTDAYVYLHLFRQNISRLSLQY